MENEILHTSNFLNGLFTEKDFKFITNSEKEIEDIKDVIITQEARRDTIVEYINNLNDSIATSEDDITLKELLSSGTKIFESINESINLLYTLKRTLNSIIQSTVDLLVSIEMTKKDKDFYADIISSIEEKITSFSKENNEVLKKVDEINEEYNVFILEEKNEPYTKMIDRNTMTLKEFEKTSRTRRKGSLANKVISIPDNKVLRITEEYVYLPYKCSEINDYLQKYPDEYSSVDEVIEKEFTFSRKYYVKHSVLARFRETYALIRDREAKSVAEALKHSFSLMFRYEINPAIIAACKTQDELEEYLMCLEEDKLNDFKSFKIKFEINPF